MCSIGQIATASRADDDSSPEQTPEQRTARPVRSRSPRRYPTRASPPHARAPGTRSTSPISCSRPRHDLRVLSRANPASSCPTRSASSEAATAWWPASKNPRRGARGAVSPWSTSPPRLGTAVPGTKSPRRDRPARSRASYRHQGGPRSRPDAVGRARGRFGLLIMSRGVTTRGAPSRSVVGLRADSRRRISALQAGSARRDLRSGGSAVRTSRLRRRTLPAARSRVVVGAPPRTPVVDSPRCSRSSSGWRSRKT